MSGEREANHEREREREVLSGDWGEDVGWELWKRERVVIKKIILKIL